MRTTREMLDFLQSNQVGSREAPKHVPLIEQALMPNEEVLFVFCGNQNSHGIESQGIHAYAITNQRFIIAQATVAFQKGNLRGVQIYMPEQLGAVTYSKGLLTGTISISFFDGTGSIMVEKKRVEFIYNGINQALLKARTPSPAPASSRTGGYKFCTKCGAQLEANAAFCASCGTKQA